jgi:hypothetical protein
VIGLYSAKQECLFGTFSTTTLRGTNLASAIGATCPPNQVGRASGRTQSGPAVLVQPLKADNSPNFNHVDHLDDERHLLACFRRNLAERSLGSIGSAYVANFELFIRPSSDYWPNPLIDRVPWRRFFDGAFSGRPLVWISLGVSVLSLWRARQRLRAALALALPAAYVFLVCVTAEHGENMRFKFFLEPAIYVWWAAQSFAAARAVAASARRVWGSALADAVSPQAAGDG